MLMIVKREPNIHRHTYTHTRAGALTYTHAHTTQIELKQPLLVRRWTWASKQAGEQAHLREEQEWMKNENEKTVYMYTRNTYYI